jgi:hypothetical protein
MPIRQFCTPHLFAAGAAHPMRRISFDDKGFGESFYQKLLVDHPLLLPIDDIEPLFAPLLSLGREIKTDAGPVDVLYISPEGYLTLVETKLWRNPEARREVVAQIIDYASAMSKWTYDQLRDAVKRAGGVGEDPLVAAAQNQPDFDQARFIDTVSRNLVKGRFLLLIVGDGIQESVEHLANTLSRSPHLSFSLALVELALFTGNTPEPLFIQPRVLARTREVVRAVVEVHAPSKTEDIVIVLPKASEGQDGSTRRKLTEEVFLENLSKSMSSELANQFRAFLRECETLGIRFTGKGQSIGLAWFDPTSGARFTFGSVYANGGWIEVKWIPQYYEQAGLDVGIAERYIEKLASIATGGRVDKDQYGERTWLKIMRGNSAVTLADVLPRAPDWLRVLETIITETQVAIASQAPA